MTTQRLKLFLVAIALIALLTSSASAAVLHDQSAIEPDWTQGFLNSIGGGPGPDHFYYGAQDVVVEGGGWVISTITIFTTYGGSEPTNAFLNIFPKTSSPLPTAEQIPNLDTPVAVDKTLVSDDVFAVTASGLDISLEPGEYWICLTPNETNAFYCTHIPAETVMGDHTATYDGSSWGYPHREWDATILIEGDETPVAAESSSLSSVKALFR